MDLLLTHGYFISEDQKEQGIMKPYVPLGMLYISSHLRAKGFDVKVYDSTFGSREELLSMIRLGPPSILGIYSTLMTRVSVLGILAVARSEGWVVVLGGPEPSACAEEYLNAGAHYVVEGEAEITLEELLRAFRNSDAASMHKVPGLVYREIDQSIVRTPARALITDLDSQPWPDREQIDLEEYLRTWRAHHGYGSLSLVTARGCPFHCRWCSHSVFANTHRRRSVKSVADEVEWMVDRYHPEKLWIADDVFTIQRSWVLQYAHEMKQRHLQVPFECITRADRVDAEVAEALAELGCFRIWIGCESGSQRILDEMERGVTLEQVQKAVRFFREAGIETGMFLMWGYEKEGVADIESTIRHIKTVQPDLFLTVLSYPIKGTKYYDDVEARLIHPQPWQESSDRDLIISGRRSKSFYAVADRLLKDEVALQNLVREGQGDSFKTFELHRSIEAYRQKLHAGDQEDAKPVPGETKQ